jgi:hypothetical protein
MRVAIIWLIAALPQLTQGQTGRIRGSVSDAVDGRPLDGARIVAYAASDSGNPPLPRGSALSGPSGRFHILGLPPGHYRLTIQRISYQPIKRQVQVRLDVSSLVDVAMVDVETERTRRRAALSVRTPFAPCRPPDQGAEETARDVRWQLNAWLTDPDFRAGRDSGLRDDSVASERRRTPTHQWRGERRLMEAALPDEIAQVTDDRALCSQIASVLFPANVRDSVQLYVFRIPLRDGRSMYAASEPARNIGLHWAPMYYLDEELRLVTLFGH